ncbi:hypothetical protein NPIL_433191 [Nephila pilipes]|uniref:Uncharacterized protein n=1 Tax=Nephila pilipes TaxID=299642 RepID=A0A8X6PSI3_NEPPI|nr:hypothetical protein NPIL_433191 [Nephila pilipes]
MQDTTIYRFVTDKSSVEPGFNQKLSCGTVEAFEKSSEASKSSSDVLNELRAEEGLGPHEMRLKQRSVIGSDLEISLLP